MAGESAPTTAVMDPVERVQQQLLFSTEVGQHPADALAQEVQPPSIDESAELRAFHLQTQQELNLQRQERQHADYADFHARMDAAIQNGNSLSTDFKWGDTETPLHVAAHQNWVDNGAHLADFHWGDTVIPAVAMHPRQPALSEAVTPVAVPGITPEYVAVPGKPTPAGELVAIGSEQFVDSTAETPTPAADDPVTVEIPRVEVPAAETTTAAPVAEYDNYGDNWLIYDEEPAQLPADAATTASALTVEPETVPAGDDTEVITTVSGDAADSEPVDGQKKLTWRERRAAKRAAKKEADANAEQQPGAFYAGKHTRGGKLLRKLNLVVDTPADEYMPGYGPREATHDNGLVEVGETGNYVDEGLVQLPNGGLTKGAYKKLRKENEKLDLPEEGIGATLRPDQREEQARTEIWADIEAEVDRDQPARIELMNEIRGYMPRLNDETTGEYMSRVRTEFDHRVAERYYGATVEAGIPQSRMVSRRDSWHDRYEEQHTDNPNDYITEEGRTRRFFRRVAGLGGAALNLRSNLNTYGVLRAEGVVDSAEEADEA